MKIQAWICDSLHRQFPSAIPGRPKTLDLVVARGERVSFQVGVRTENTEVKDVAVASNSQPARSTTRSVVGGWP
ncbi:MAG: hypothetical protein HY343_13695, partial [Lentisphaerae bacterium]|nr:hypothetical protein [Lentisphaerota bacterium]